MAYPIMEAAKSQDLLSVSWRLKNSWCFSFSLEAGKTDVPAQQLGRKSSLLLLGVSNFLFYSNLLLIGRVLPTLGRAICFIQMPIASRNTFTGIPTIMFDQSSGYFMVKSNWHIKLTITISLVTLKNQSV